MHPKRRPGRAALVAACLGLATLAAAPRAAADGKADAGATTLMEMPVDEARIMRLARTPASVIVGNPLIADVAVEENGIVVVVGKNYGTTNLIALSAEGEELAHIDIAVRTSGSGALSLFRGVSRYSYNCQPRCETELDVGDDFDHFDGMRKSVGSKLQLSTGVAEVGP
jgi:hypothetical protein